MFADDRYLKYSSSALRPLFVNCSTFFSLGMIARVAILSRNIKTELNGYAELRFDVSDQQFNRCSTRGTVHICSGGLAVLLRFSPDKHSSGRRFVRWFAKKRDRMQRPMRQHSHYEPLEARLMLHGDPDPVLSTTRIDEADKIGQLTFPRRAGRCSGQRQGGCVARPVGTTQRS